MQLRRTWMLLLLLSTTTACRTEPSAQELAKELRTVTSWATTAQMVSQAWLQNRVPTPYAKQTLRKTQETLQTELDTIAKVAPPQNRATVLNQVKQLEQTVEQMVTKIDQQNRTALAQTLPVLQDQAQVIHRLEQEGGQP